MIGFKKSVVSVACASALLGSLSLSGSAQAETAETAPAELTSAIAAIEAAANAQNIDQLMALYGSDFIGPDDFTRDQYQTTLSEFWAQYSTLTYDVELLSWEANGDILVAETLTTITGTQSIDGRNLALTSTVESRQNYAGGQVVAQTILSEQTQLMSGTMPPTVDVRLAETVAPGESFSFDAIVAEPLGDRLLLGVAVNEGVTAEDFLTPRPLNLEALSAGGLFKIGTASDKPDQRWVSAVLISDDGIFIDTRRLSIEE